MKKIQQFARFITALMCLTISLTLSAQVIEWEDYFQMKNVRSKNVISNCHQINAELITLQCFKSNGSFELWVSGMSAPVEGYFFMDVKPLEIEIADDSVSFSQLEMSLKIKYLGVIDGIKQYRISGADLDGVTFNKVITGKNRYRNNPIEFYKYARYAKNYRYQDPLGYEDMEGNEPTFLNVVKKWASKFKKAHITYL